MAHDDEPRQREARRIIDRIERETDPGGTGIVSRTMRRAEDHFGAADADRDDPIEVWGTRIGRAVGLVLTLALLAWLVTSLSPA